MCVDVLSEKGMFTAAGFWKVIKIIFNYINAFDTDLYNGTESTLN